VSPTKRCTGCRMNFPRTAKHYHRNSDSPDGFRARCRDCKRHEDAVRHGGEMPARERVPKKGRHCHACEGLAHRREVDGCPMCGEAHVPEKPMTIAEYLEQPRDDRRTIP